MGGGVVVVGGGSSGSCHGISRCNRDSRNTSYQ